MKLVIGKKADINYLAKIVRIELFKAHSNPEVKRLKCCTIDGFNIITSIDSPPGLYVYFPVMSQLNPNFLSYANLYRHSEKNNNPEKSGMFEDNGRVKAIALKGEKSEGFIIDYQILENWIVSVTNKDLNISVGQEFDSVEDGNKSFWVCRKYIIKENTPRSSRGNAKYKISGKLQDKVIPSQFRFHYQTLIYRKVPNFINPTDIIHISSKIHGTSGISANVLVREEKTFKNRLLKWITENIFKKTYNDTKYDNLYASRTVIKNKYYNKEVSSGYYNIDVWKYADNIVKPHLPVGYTAYYEIVGYLPDGKFIQKNYDYGCVPPSEGKYENEKNFKVRIYRITITNINGDVYELTPTEVQRWCKENGLNPVKELYCGQAASLYGLPESEEFGKWFIDKLADDGDRFYMELDSPDCNNKVPHEGIVLKVLGKNSEATKLKCFHFLSHESSELDNGISNIEDEN